VGVGLLVSAGLGVLVGVGPRVLIGARSSIIVGEGLVVLVGIHLGVLVRVEKRRRIAGRNGVVSVEVHQVRGMTMVISPVVVGWYHMWCRLRFHKSWCQWSANLVVTP
jgi:hypothetical protein